MNNLKTKTRLYSASIILLLVSLLVLPVHAQTTPSSAIAPTAWTTLIAREEPRMQVLNGEVGATGLADVDFDALTRSEWKALRATLLTTLRSGQDAAWEDAVLQTIYLAMYYPDQVNLKRTAGPLLESYILDRDEKHRIMALAALHALGHRDAMAHLVQRVHLERSPRVRRLTVAALADHYGVRDYYNRREGAVTVSPPTFAKGQ